MNSWISNLTGKIHPEAERVITALEKTLLPIPAKLQELEASLTTIMKPGLSKGTASFLHAEDLSRIATELSAAGSSPLNVGSLIGELSQPQKAMVTVNNSSSGTPATPPVIPPMGNLVVQNGQLFYFDNSTVPGSYKPIVSVATLVFDTYANWTLLKYDPSTYPSGTVFVISDWGVIYWVQSVASVPTWVFLSGTYEAPFSSLPTTGFNGVALGINDKGLRFYDSTTYHRAWEWGGAGWGYAAGELPGGDTSPAIMILGGNSVPPGWSPCNGSTIIITQSTATTVSFTTPNLNGGFYPKGGSYSATPNAAVVPTVASSSSSVNAGVGAPSTFIDSVGPISLPGDPIPNIVVPFYVKL